MEPRTLLEALSVAERLKDTTRHYVSIDNRRRCDGAIYFPTAPFAVYFTKLVTVLID